MRANPWIASVLLLVAASLAAGTAVGATRRVPSEYATIQAAIDASALSDIVLVAPGAYAGHGNTDLDFHGVDLICRSEAGPLVTLINAAAPEGHRGFHLSSGESRAAVIEGFTIVNGDASVGGGIACVGASPTVRNCVVRDCRAEKGGGIFLRESSARFERVSVLSCRVNAGEEGEPDGAALFVVDSAAELEDCALSGNLASETWSGMAAVRLNGGGVMRRCVVSGNEGIGVSADDATLDHCVIAFNQAEEIESASTLTIEGCIVRDTCDPIDLLLQPGSDTSVACTMLDAGKVAGAGTLQFLTPPITGNPLFCDIPNCPSIPSVDGNFAVFPDSPARPEYNACGDFLGAIEASSCDPAAVDGGGPTALPAPRIEWISASPNPTSGALSLAFRLRESDRVRIRLLSPDGRVVTTLDDRDRAAGEQLWAGQARAGEATLAAGVYAVELLTDSERSCAVVVLLPK